jgi:uncharacterized surface protein with fasciclin (FAS1) repeats
MKYKSRYSVILIGMFFLSCQDRQWDDHGKITMAGIDANLLTVIQSHPDASVFSQALVATGYDHLLTEANNFTVFVPGNAAWQGVNPADVEALRKIVANHIIYGKKPTSESSLYEPLQAVGNKVIRYDRQTQSFNGAQIVSSNHFAGNGVFHITDQIVTWKQSIWEYISGKDYLQVEYINTLNQKAIDIKKSIQVGVNSTGNPVYDTVWINVNHFLEAAPLDDESKELTYIILKDEGFQHLVDKYKPYFTLPTPSQTDSLTRFQVCGDFIFEGIVDITQYDTLINLSGVKVPVKNIVVEDTYDASNGRVYIIDRSDILLREKIKPVFMEGEDFTQAASASYLFIQYKLWASGTRSIALMSGVQQTNTLDTIGSEGQDSTYNVSATFRWGDQNSGLNMNNSWIEYKLQVHSADYEIHYLSYDDLSDHVFSDVNRNMRFQQKLYASLPGQPVLKKGGNSTHADAIINNYLGDTRCFAGRDTAGIYKERKMQQWSLLLSATAPQLLDQPVTDPGAEILSVPQTGALTLWLCNTTGSTSSFFQGWLFLDYLKLVPKLPEE